MNVGSSVFCCSVLERVCTGDGASSFTVDVNCEVCAVATLHAAEAEAMHAVDKQSCLAAKFWVSLSFVEQKNLYGAV